MGIMRSLAVLSILLHVALAIPPLDVIESNPDPILPRVEDTDYRLSDDLTPLEYDLTLKNIDFENFTFTGTVKIKFVANRNSSIIKMHSRVTKITSFTIDGTTLDNNTETTIPDLHFVSFQAKVEEKKEYTMTINYNAEIQDDMSGFYRSWYKEGENTVWLGSTQFQPVYARKVFPCFDEPKFKAVFRISIDCPTGYTCVSNMPEKNSKDSLINFHETPKMSTYLIAFIVSKFVDVSENTTMSDYRILARPEAMGMGKYPFATGSKIVNVLGAHFNYTYKSMNPNMKMDHAAIPDFSAGAMENWGLITYREAYLMFKEGETSPRYKQQVATILAHEIVHMWFGNLVTCNWWSNTWLNEGFATFFQYFVSLESEDMGLEDQFVITQLQTALSADTPLSSSPMSNDAVNRPDQISAHFSTISYQKGGSIIRMIQHMVGKEEFRQGLIAHLKNKEFQNAEPNDLFAALDSKANLTQYNTTVKEVMESWSSKSGYPLLSVTVNHAQESVTLRQERFSKEGETANASIIYNIPITFTTDSEWSFADTTPAFIMKEKEATITEGFSHGWVLFNIQESGFYRVNYDVMNWYALADALKENRTSIHRFNRAQLVDDAMNLAREGRMNYTMMMDIIEFLENEIEYPPWQAAINGFSFLRLQFGRNGTVAERFDYYINKMMEKLVKDIGLDGVGSHLTRMFRGNAMNLACNAKNEDCIASAMDLYKKLMNATSPTIVNPDIREYVYCNALRYGGDAEYNFLWNKYATDNVVSEKVIILGALGCTQSHEKLMDFLGKTLDPMAYGIRDQDRMSAFNSAVSGNRENGLIVFEFIKEKAVEIRRVYGALGGLFSGITSRMNGTELDELEGYLNTSDKVLNDDEVKVVRDLIASARSSITWAESKHEQVLDWIENKYNSAGTIAVTFSLLMAMLVALFFNQQH